MNSMLTMKFFSLVFLMIVHLAVSKNVKLYCDTPGVCLVHSYFNPFNFYFSIFLEQFFYNNIHLFLLFIVTNFEWNVDWNDGIMLEILPRNPKLQMDVLFGSGQKLCCLPTLQRNYGNEWLYYQPSWMYIPWPAWKVLVIFLCMYVTSNFFM